MLPALCTPALPPALPAVGKARPAVLDEVADALDLS